MARAWLLGLAALAAAALPGCGSGERTQLVVLVESDLAVPAQLGSVHVEIGPDSGCSECAHEFALAGEGAVTLPFSFGIQPRDGDASRPVALVVEGRREATAVVRRSVRTGFVRGRTVLLRVRLEAGCAGMLACGDGTTCIGGACASDAVDPASLPEIEPGRELGDAGVGDAGVGDAGVGDAGDAGGDAGGLDAGSLLPRDCTDLSDGVQTIDADGAGPEPAFAVWCEAGWALIARLDGRTSDLAYDAAAWTSDDVATHAQVPPVDPGAAGSMLFESYWRLPVRELRIRMAAPATPLEIVHEDALLAGASGPITMRAAMAAGTVRVVLPAPTWLATFFPSEMLPSIACERQEIPAITPNARVRIGFVASASAACDPADAWFGLGAVATPSGSCVGSSISAGGARLCGPAGQRFDEARIVVLFGR